MQSEPLSEQRRDNLERLHARKANIRSSKIFFLFKKEKDIKKWNGSLFFVKESAVLCVCVRVQIGL